jgi:hypothetical protein
LGVVRPGYLGQRLLDNRASGGPPQDVIAIHAVSVAASAVQGRGALTVANVHICGEGYAGKSMTRQALMKCFNSSTGLFLSSPLPDIPLEDGRTLGMVSASLERAAWLSGGTVRVLLHDYGGQEEFRANHAAHLAAPNSVYLLVVPLWDKRPKADDSNQSVNKPMELKHIVRAYRRWLKFIYSVVSESEAGVQCITAVNFAEQYKNARGEQKLKEAVDALRTVSDDFKRKRVFAQDPVLVNARNAASVNKCLVTPLREAIAKLARVPIPVSPALQTVLADMQVKGKWPLFSYESDLQALLRAAIRTDLKKYSPSAELIGDPALAEEVVRTIAEITQGLLESRRDILVFPVQGGGRISINHPNWLTEKLLGNLFKPQKEVKGKGLEAHFLTAKKIAEAGVLGLQRGANDLADSSLFAKLLHHIGACIPVMRAVSGGAALCNVSSGTDKGDADPLEEYFFPAFITTPMQPTDCEPTATAVERVIRRFTVPDSELTMIPAGYYPALFVAVASLESAYRSQQRAVPKQIWLYKDGMVLKVDASYRVIVRGNAADTAFELEVEVIRSDYPGSAFAEMEKIRDLIVNAQDWRSAVQLVEWCVDPHERDRADAVPLSTYQALIDARQELTHGETLYYYGVQRPGAHGVTSRAQSKPDNEVLARLNAIDRKLDQHHGEVVSRLEALADGVSALCVSAEAAEKAEEALQRAEGMGAASQEQLASLIEVLTAALPAADHEATMERSDAPAVRDVTHSLAQHRDQILSAAQGSLSEAQLQQMKEEIVGEFSRLAEGMQRAAYEQLKQAEEAQVQRLEQLLDRNREAAVADLEAAMEALRVQQQSQARSVGGVPTAVTEQLLQLQASLDAVRAAQDADSYGLYEVPLLVEVEAAQPKGTVRDAAKRCLYEIHRLHFCCPACGKRAASGPNQHGYELRSTRGWVQQAARVLKVTLFALQVASLVTPLPLPRLAELGDLLPVSDAEAVAGALDFVRKQVQGNATATIGAVRDAVEKQLTSAQLQALSVAREHVSSVRALLLKASDGIPPKDSGLAPVVCAGTRECAWVCAGCSDTYRERGSACLAVKISLD